MDYTQQTTAYPLRIFVRIGKRIISVQTKDILWIEAFGDYSKLHTADKSYLCNLSLQMLEKRLDPSRFMRVHRSSIVAFQSLKHLSSDGEGAFIATLENGITVRVSRTYAAKIKHLIW